MKFWFILLGGLWFMPTLQADSVVSYGQALTLGGVQGVTEFLPVSSSCHMLLANRLLFPNIPSDGASAIVRYIIWINLGTILVLLGYYRKDWLRIGRGLAGRDSDGLNLCIKLICSLLASCVAVCIFKPLASWLTIDQTSYPIMGCGLLLGGVAIFLMERFQKYSIRRPITLDTLARRQAILIGLCQAFALCPGVSRSLSTILAGIFVGLTLSEAIHFSFLLGCITASAQVAVSALSHFQQSLELVSLPALCGVLTAFVVGSCTIRFLFRLLQTKGLIPFGYYRIVLGCLLLFL
ncbi:MAG: undecaprenyl-diphosphate phosphatase [Opitutales bacterium]|nr:undecaprenyl-diphosphate phosphatase [Opitutales bacterium]